MKKINNFNSDFNHPKHVQYGEWESLQNQQIHSKKYNHMGDNSYYHLNAEMYQSYVYKKRKQQIMNDFDQSKVQNRLKRNTGKL